MPGSGINVKLIGDWAKAKKILEAAPELLNKACEIAVEQEAVWLAGEMKKKFRSLQPANSPFTLLMKRSSKPGINKGDLRNSIGAVQVDKLVWFVGIPAKARTVKSVTRGEGGKFTSSSGAASIGSNVRLGRIFEEGRTIVMPMTDKQRKFLHATLGRKVSKVGGGSSGVLVIHIPPRPFIRPTFEMAQQGAEDRLLRRVLSNLKLLGK